MSAIVGGITDTVAALSISGVLSPKAAPTSSTTTTTQSVPSTPPPAAGPPPASSNQPQVHFPDDMNSQSQSPDDATEGKNYRMDVQDFIE